MMELEDIESDLQALRRLYGLLQANADNKQISKKDILDQRAQVLLKRLLDAAKEKLFENYSEIISTARKSASNTIFSSKPEQARGVQKLQPSYSPDRLSASPSFSKNSRKDLNYHAITLSTNQQILEKQKLTKISTELSRTSLSSNTSELRKKRCRVCEERSTKQQNSSNIPGRDSIPQGYGLGEFSPSVLGSGRVNRLPEQKEKSNKPLKSKATTNQIRIQQLQRNESNASSVAFSSSSPICGGVKLPRVESNLAGRAVKISDTTSNGLTKDMADAIEGIENQISALQLCSTLESTNHSAVNLWLSRVPSSVTPIVQGEEKLAMKTEEFVASDYVPDQTNGHSQPAIQVNTTGMNQMLYQGQTNSPTQVASQKGRNERGKIGQTSVSNLNRNLNLGHQMNQTVNEIELNASLSQRTSHSVNATEKRTESLDAAQSQGSQYVHGLRVPQTHDSLTMSFQLGKNLSHNNHLPPVAPLRKVAKSRQPMPPHPLKSVGPSRPGQKRSMSHKLTMKPTLLDQDSQSSYEDPSTRKRGWTRIARPSRNKFMLHQQESEEEATSSYSNSHSSPSWTSLPNSISESYSSSPSQTWASSSRNNAHVTDSESSEESNSSYSTQSHYDDRAYPRKAYRSGDYASSKKKTIGRLRRFKNKLGLIFHHHHHHHHHHHRDNADDESNLSEDGHKPSPWKHLSKMFHQKGIRKSYEKEAVGRPRKKGANSVAPHQHQFGHFHALVEGLMGHIRHSKKSKPTKKRIRRLQSHTRDCGGKVVKKLHWWQMFKRQGGVKLPNRGRLKLGHTSKKPQVRAFKKS